MRLAITFFGLCKQLKSKLCWKLFESGDPILIEVGVAFVLSFFVFIFNEVVTGLEKRVKSLEERINELEKKE